MPALPSDLRRLLDTAVQKARDEAETAARAALKRLAVAGGPKDVPAYLSEHDKSVRRALRAHARQLGDPWDEARQSFSRLDRLAHEVAYEHWHRMLFARFLAENGLLIHPEFKVAVDLKTVAEIAAEEAARTGSQPDPWAVAGRFAARMLPQIFRPGDPVLQVELAPEHQQALEARLESLPPAVFTADDALGWVYQFWQSAEKDRVNSRAKAGEKITGATLPAVTQLFTEHYMVLFLLHNTVGAWWAGRKLAGRRELRTATSEQELRDLLATTVEDGGGFTFDYLRFVKEDGKDEWRPAAGTYDTWPKTVAALKVLDPCCGSGHFLVAALELLARLRAAEEGLSLRDALSAVLRDNLHGLELDPRCTQLAAFNLAFTAWKLAGEVFELPEVGVQVACSGIGPEATEEQWLKLADRPDPSLHPHARQRIRDGLVSLHRTFQLAPELGSLIDPRDASGPAGLFTADYETVLPYLTAAVEAEKTDELAAERAVAAQGMAKAAELLAGEYTLVITNVPYLGRAGQSDVIKDFCETFYADAKTDLATVFVSRMLKWVVKRGTVAAVTPQNWLFLGGYSRLRERLLREHSWNIIGRLGPKGFQTPMWDFNVMLFALSGALPHLDHGLAGIDAMSARTAAAKAAVLRGDERAWKMGAADENARSCMVSVDVADIGQSPHVIEGDVSVPPNGLVRVASQVGQLRNADARISLEVASDIDLLSEVADYGKGSTTGDSPRFLHSFWESPTLAASNVKWLDSPNPGAPWSGRSLVCTVPLTDVELTAQLGCRIHGHEVWGRPGIAVNKMSDLLEFMYDGEVFDDNVGVLAPRGHDCSTAIWAFCESGEYRLEVRKVDQALKVTAATLVKVPFDLAHWQKVAAEKYPNGLPEPESDDPTQWLFHGHPGKAEKVAVLQVAVARLAGYRWPAELDPAMRLSAEARRWVAKCRELEAHADADGVVPLVKTGREAPAEQRVRDLLAAAFGRTLPPTELAELLTAAGSPGKSLDQWLRDDFFAQHCGVFHSRPFVWHLWDGRKDGFSALVNYHRLCQGDGKGAELLRSLTYNTLGDWITQQAKAAKDGVAGADLRLRAAQDLQKKLEAILEGEPPYDLFVRWKPLHQQPIGWAPDINDGVRINIRPFIEAGVLRSRVNINWRKDRGKEPESIRPREMFPWFWGWDEEKAPQDFEGAKSFTGERFNDLHYTTAFKRAARARAEKEGWEEKLAKLSGGGGGGGGGGRGRKRASPK